MSQSEYCKYYESQRGGEIPVFRGGLQSGAGLGDILRGIFRFVMPIALRGIQTFAGRTLAATQAGVPLPAAAKSAIMPTISSIAGSAAPTIARMMNTVMPGFAGNATSSQPASQTGKGVLFDGQNGIPDTPKAIEHYKRTSTGVVSGTVAKQRKRAKQHSATTSGAHYNF